MTTPEPTAEGQHRSRTHAPDSGAVASVLKLGGTVSVLQSGLFVVIGVAAVVLRVDRLVDYGFASLPSADPAAFRVLCAAFVLIAVLGLAITAAERALIEASNAGLAGFGATLAYLGHCGTIAFFSWWLLRSIHGGATTVDLNVVAPLDWGVMFELVFVGAWVWIIAWVGRGERSWRPGFLLLTAAKATSFWFAAVAFVTNEKWMILVGVGAVTFVTGPWWHLWIARTMTRRAGAIAHGR